MIVIITMTAIRLPRPPPEIFKLLGCGCWHSEFALLVAKKIVRARMVEITTATTATTTTLLIK